MHYECSMVPGRASRGNVRGKIKKVLDDEVRKKQQTILKSPHRKEKLELFNWLQVNTLLGENEDRAPQKFTQCLCG